VRDGVVSVLLYFLHEVEEMGQSSAFLKELLMKLRMSIISSPQFIRIILLVFLSVPNCYKSLSMPPLSSPNDRWPLSIGSPSHVMKKTDVSLVCFIASNDQSVTLSRYQKINGVVNV
jgi:hypothetical protein